MYSRDVDLVESDGFKPPCVDLVLRTPPNWTAVTFLIALGCLHLAIAIPNLLHDRWEGFLSLIFGVLFVAGGITCWRLRHEVAICGSLRQIQVRTGLGLLGFKNFLPFSAVHGVRLTLAPDTRRPRNSKIELLCAYDDIECPPTTIPRQQALFLALMIGVPLIKVSQDDAAEPTQPTEESSRPGMTQRRE